MQKENKRERKIRSFITFTTISDPSKDEMDVTSIDTAQLVGFKICKRDSYIVVNFYTANAETFNACFYFDKDKEGPVEEIIKKINQEILDFWVLKDWVLEEDTEEPLLDLNDTFRVVCADLNPNAGFPKRNMF